MNENSNDRYLPTILFLRLNYHIEVSNAADVSKMEDDFAEEIKKRGEDFKFFQDQYGEHPDDRVVKNEEVSEKLADVQTLTQIFGGLKEKVNKVQLTYRTNFLK